MTRREFTGAAAALTLGGPLAQAAPRVPAIIELRWIYMRNGPAAEMRRTSEFLAKTALPALTRAGAGPLGLFGSVIAPESPFILALSSYPDWASYETCRNKEQQDAEYRKGREAFYGGSGLPYQRIDNALLRCFPSMPAVDPPPAREGGGSRIFELRTYQSNTQATLARKLQMFADGEIAIFRRLGMRPVFFGETLIGKNLPNLTYMLAFDSLQQRESAWGSFGKDPDWAKLRSKHGYSDDEIVSNISNMILQPLAFSPIR